MTLYTADRLAEMLGVQKSTCTLPISRSTWHASIW